MFLPSKYFLLTILLIGGLLSCGTPKRISKINEFVKLYPIGKKGMWGYANEKGEVVIDYKFEEADFFISGLAGVKKDGRYGFVNRLGDFEIKPKYDSVSTFAYDKAQVYKRGKSFLINRIGKKIKGEGIVRDAGCVLPNEVAKPLDFFNVHGDVFQLKDKEFAKQVRLDPTAGFQIEDFTFDKIIPFTSRSFIVQRQGKFGVFMHYNGVGLKEVWADDLQPFYAANFADGKTYETNMAKMRRDDRWGLISGNGEIVIEPEFLSITQVKGVFYLVEYQPDHWGYLTLSKRFFKN